MGKRIEIYYNHNVRWLKNLLRRVVKWNNLPASIYEPALNDYLLWQGYTVGFEYKKEVVVAQGAISGLDMYYRPTKFTSANPYIVPTQKRTPGKDCCICYNTTNYQYPENFNTLVDIYARRLAEIDLSIETSVKNSRVCLIAVVDNDKEAIRVGNILKQIYDGEPATLAYKVQGFQKGEQNVLMPINARDNIVVMELADARRNILADFWQEIGVDTVAVDKKERTNLSEMNSNKTQTLLSQEIILKPRQDWCDAINAMFNLNISVEMNEATIEQSMMFEEVENDGSRFE